MWNFAPRRASLLSVTALMLISTAGSAAGAEAVALAVHPLVVVGGSPQESGQLQETLLAEVVQSGVKAVSAFTEGASTDVSTGCVDDDPCLARVTRSVGAERGLLITAAPFAPMLVMTGRLVDSTGAVLAAVSDVRVPRDGRMTPELVRVGVRAVLRQLGIGSMKGSLVASDPSVHRSAFPWSPPVALAAGGAGLALTATGIAFLVHSENRWRAYEALYAGGNAFPADVPRLVALRDEALRARTVGLVTGGVGVVALATSAVLYLRASASPVSLTAGPGSVGVAGSLP